MKAYHAQYYDQFFVGVPGDVEYYMAQAAALGEGSVLEIGAGTGRILGPLSRAATRVVGLEPDADLRECAARRLAGLGQEHPSARLVAGRMETMDLDERFAAIFLPYRVFQHLLTPVDQEEALARIHAHLQDGGVLAMDTFDPLAEIARDGMDTPLRPETDFVDCVSGHRVVVSFARRIDPQLQLLEQDFVFEEVDGDGVSRQRILAQLVLRYTPSQEMIYLLELCGFVVESLRGDFTGGPYLGCGNQIWIARRV